MIHRERLIPPEGNCVGVLTSSYADLHLDMHRIDVSKNDNTNYLNSTLGGYQITDTESHPEWLRRRKGTYRGDIGGPFRTEKRFAKFGQGSCSSFRQWEPTEFEPAGRYTSQNSYSGPYLPYTPYWLGWPAMPEPSSNDSLDEYGTTAIARCSPSNPSVDLTVAIGEIIHEGIPKLVGGTLRELRSLTGRERRQALGHEYLNVEFGWKPFINDLRNFAKAIVDADSILKNYQRNSGKMVRRSYDFPEESSHNVWTVFPLASPWFSPSASELFIPGFTQWGKVYRTDEVSVRRWFRGAFTYYVPPANSLRNSMARAVIQARKLLGISLTPDSLWNLAPWSWAVDWFFNTGDLLSNWTDWAIDNQVLVYGYVMEHKRVQTTYTFAGNTGLFGGSQPIDVVLVCETKVRRQATPYGFGLQWDDLSARQKTIIAALGISRKK
jgi:hypothetical protein